MRPTSANHKNVANHAQHATVTRPVPQQSTVVHSTTTPQQFSRVHSIVLSTTSIVMTD
ncbi:hypothetical protein PAXRUDRAFT_563990 [Paxillus rubicundulus Ve08.2h10]|uniref:Uncharacterized protein n=1 Tax=Paxillus rubicundulus Ve08.2h10 TaxID=930991 RepID=A0A0D0D2C9_9AGAM|nr:hypothetical protein PAXRUDRAFT_563990 [Paxillus rubicundulus Ve08.2h10]